MFSKRTIQFSLALRQWVVGVAVIAALGSAFLAGSASRTPSASAAVEPSANHAPQTEKFYSCTIADVYSFKTRVHVRCTIAANGISYFVVPTADSGFAARMQALATAAYLSGKPVGIWYDDADLSGVPYGCSADNCRVLGGIGF